MTRVLFEEIINRFILLSRDEIREKLTAKETPALVLMVLAVMHEAVGKGDQMRLDFILNRMIGKVPERVEVDDIKAPDFSDIPREKIIAKLRRS